MTEYILDHDKIQKDLEAWAKKLRNAIDKLMEAQNRVREVYMEMNKIYMANQ